MNAYLVFPRQLMTDQSWQICRNKADGCLRGLGVEFCKGVFHGNRSPLGVMKLSEYGDLWIHFKVSDE